jgi:hypothetical protein
MGVLSHVLNLVGFVPKEPDHQPEKKRMTEAAGSTVHPDHNDRGWRQVGGNSRSDLGPMKQERMQAKSAKLWKSTPLGNRLTELSIAYILGKGVELRVDDDQAQAILNEHWRDGINNWPARLHKRIRALSLYGEQCWVATNDELGRVRWGAMSPVVIATVINDPQNADVAIAVITKTDASRRQLRFRTILSVPEAELSETAQRIRASCTDGECLYTRINDIDDETRGGSDQLHLFNWLDDYEDFLLGDLDRARNMRNFFWDVELTGADENLIQKRESEIVPPNAGAVRIHNESEKWTAVSPDLKSHDTDTIGRNTRNHILGGLSVPPTWFSQPEDSNRSTGDAMAEATERMIEMRRHIVGEMLCAVGRYVLMKHWQLTDENPNEKQKKILSTLRAEWPPLKPRDITKFASAFQGVAAGISSARQSAVISVELSVRLIAAIAEQIGVQVDVQNELKSIKEESDAQNDLDRMPSDDDTNPI